MSKDGSDISFETLCLSQWGRMAITVPGRNTITLLRRHGQHPRRFELKLVPQGSRDVEYMSRLPPFGYYPHVRPVASSETSIFVRDARLPHPRLKSPIMSTRTKSAVSVSSIKSTVRCREPGHAVYRCFITPWEPISTRRAYGQLREPLIETGSESVPQYLYGSSRKEVETAVYPSESSSCHSLRQ